MKQQEFLTKACKAIAANKIKSGAERRLIVEIAANGFCRPVWQISKNYSDHTMQVIGALESLGIQKQGTCINGVNIRRGYLIQNDAPRGGKLGTIIKVTFE
jgi:hypothetical protein